MAVIKSSDIKTETTLVQTTSDYNIEVNLDNKILNKKSNFPVIVVGDNNSVILAFKAPLEYNGIDLYGTNCIITYNTTWTDKNNKPSSGQVDLTNSCLEKEDYLLYTWILDINQTAKVGSCKFNISFLMNLEADPYINNTNIYTKQDEEENSINFVQKEVNEIHLNYWSVSTSSLEFNIEDSILPIGGYNIVLPSSFEQELEEIKALLSNKQ